MPETKTETLPLVWKFDGDGSWEAVSRVMDPDMIDQPVDQWCREWCLMWRIHVLEDGTFSANESDKLLREEQASELRSVWTQLALLQNRIDLIEAELRESETIGTRESFAVCLLDADKYKA